MLRVSKLTDYGTVVLARMAQEPAQVFSAQYLADEVALPSSTVRKLLKRLTQQGLLQSCRGQQGGYRLAQAPTEISLADVIEALEGPLGLTECSCQAGLCRHEGHCEIRHGWQGINDIIVARLRQLSLRELVQPVQEANRIV